MPAWCIARQTADQCNAARTSCSIAPGSAPEEQAVTLQQITLMMSRKRHILQVDFAIAVKSSAVGSIEGSLDFAETHISNLPRHITKLWASLGGQAGSARGRHLAWANCQ